MARSRSSYVCQQCGHQAPAWSGRCGGCGEWNSLVETRPEPAGGGRSAGRAATTSRPVVLRDVEAPAVDRLLTGVAELDRVLGEGLVAGSLVLLGG